MNILFEVFLYAQIIKKNLVLQTIKNKQKNNTVTNEKGENSLFPLAWKYNHLNRR